MEGGTGTEMGLGAPYQLVIYLCPRRARRTVSGPPQMAVAGTDDLHKVGYALACSRRGDWQFQTSAGPPAWQQADRPWKCPLY